jgi:hypothetical protein
MTWKQAHMAANLAAAQAHRALGVNTAEVPVDVVGAITAANVTLMWQPMPRIFGAYLDEPGGRPGILVNSGLPPGARRYTAAHELGHHWLRHSTAVDDGSTIDTVAREEFDAIPAANRRRTWSDQEKAAEAFAAWFLMPHRGVVAALQVLGLDRPRTALDAYCLSLLLGTSYRSTVRHLPNLKLVHPSNCRQWAAVAPGHLKAALDAGFLAPASRMGDVWRLTPAFDGRLVVVCPGDRLVVEAGAVSSALPLVPTWMNPVPRTERTSDSSSAAVYEFTGADRDEMTGTLVARSAGNEQPAWQVHLRGVQAPRGVDPRGVA